MPYKRTGKPRGRPMKFSKETFAEKVEEYFEFRMKKEKGPMTVLDFCNFADVDKDYIQEHDLKDKSKSDFSVSIKRLKTKCEGSYEYMALNGTIDKTMAIFSLKCNYGWKEPATSHEISGPGGQAIETKVVTVGLPPLNPEEK